MAESAFRHSVDQTVASAMLRRAAYRRPGEDLSHLPELWRDRARQILGWTYRTHFGIFLTGLIAKASDPQVNPLCLQSADDLGEAGRYNPAGVWPIFYERAVKAGVATNGLKSAPHNNATYFKMGETMLRMPISKNKRTIEYVANVYDWLSELDQMTSADVQAALDAFLVEVPDLSTVSALEMEATRIIRPEDAFVALEEFINADTENGRRGQAFMAACLELNHGTDVETPQSVNDPSRNSLGDATLRTSEKLQGIEAKQKIVTASDIRGTAKDLGNKVNDATLIYGALVNGLDAKPLARHWREITKATGVLTVIHDDPATALRDAIIATGRPFTPTLADFCSRYHERLAYVGVKEATLAEWLQVAAELGVLVMTSQTTDGD